MLIVAAAAIIIIIRSLAYYHLLSNSKDSNSAKTTFVCVFVLVPGVFLIASVCSSIFFFHFFPPQISDILSLFAIPSQPGSPVALEKGGNLTTQQRKYVKRITQNKLKELFQKNLEGKNMETTNNIYL